jgi:hypothetical protein
MAGVINSDSPLPDRQMGLNSAAWYSTGFPGSDSPDVASATHGPVVGNPIVSVPLASSQVPENMPRLPVTSGDTSGFSDDLPVHQDVLTPPMSDVTGIGHGSIGHRP